MKTLFTSLLTAFLLLGCSTPTPPLPVAAGSLSHGNAHAAETLAPLSSQTTRVWLDYWTNYSGVYRTIHIAWTSVLTNGYRVDFSPDLVTWKTLGTCVGDQSVATNSLDIIDATSQINAVGYYRLVPLGMGQ